VPHVGKLYRFPIGIFRPVKCPQARWLHGMQYRCMFYPSY
jgi:hypothetical protein